MAGKKIREVSGITFETAPKVLTPEQVQVKWSGLSRQNIGSFKVDYCLSVCNGAKA